MANLDSSGHYVLITWLLINVSFKKLILEDKLDPLGIIDILLQPCNEVKILKIIGNYNLTTLLSNYAKSSDGQRLIVKL